MKNAIGTPVEMDALKGKIIITESTKHHRYICFFNSCICNRRCFIPTENPINNKTIPKNHEQQKKYPQMFNGLYLPESKEDKKKIERQPEIRTEDKIGEFGDNKKHAYIIPRLRLIKEDNSSPLSKF
jgi:hypothetical protein